MGLWYELQATEDTTNLNILFQAQDFLVTFLYFIQCLSLLSRVNKDLGERERERDM